MSNTSIVISSHEAGHAITAAALGILKDGTASDTRGAVNVVYDKCADGARRAYISFAAGEIAEALNVPAEIRKTVEAVMKPHEWGTDRRQMDAILNEYAGDPWEPYDESAKAEATRILLFYWNTFKAIVSRMQAAQQISRSTPEIAAMHPYRMELWPPKP
jgi:hypothetical protein